MFMYMDMALKRDEDEAEKKKAEHFINYLIALYTAPTFGGKNPELERGRKELVESLKPKREIQSIPTNQDWDADHMKYVQQQLKQ